MNEPTNPSCPATESRPDGIESTPEAPSQAPTSPDPTAASPSAVPVDCRRGRFTILRAHAHGGLGQVSLARDEKLKRQVALKEIRPDRRGQERLRQRFLAEAEITGMLEHPGIVPIYTIEEDADANPYYAMRFIEGKTLAQAIRDFHQEPGTEDVDAREGPATLRETRAPDFAGLAFRGLLQRVVSVCQTIAYAHSKGVIHRDLKPANIMRGDYGETLVLDWGLAKRVGELERDSVRVPETTHGAPARSLPHALTQSGQVLGTPGYMSPEQARGEEVAAATDIYALGAILHALLTGRPPSRADGHAEKPDQVRPAPSPRLGQARRGVPRALEAVCAKALAYQAQDRYPTATDLGQDLDRWLAGEPVSAYPEPFATRVRRWTRRRRVFVTAMAVALGVLLLSSLIAAALLGHAYRNEEQLNLALQASNTELAGKNTQLDQQNIELSTANRSERQAREQAEKVVDLMLSTFRSPDPSRDGRAVTVAEVLAQSVQRLEKHEGLDPQIRVDLYRAISQTYLGLGLADEAIPVLTRELALRQGLYGADGRETLATRNNLAGAYRDAGRLAEVVPLFEEILKRYQATLGPEHQDTLVAQFNLGLTYLDSGRNREALPLLEQVYERFCVRFLPFIPARMQAANGLARAYHACERWEEARRLFEDTLQRQRKVLGPHHPDTLLTQINLGGLYKEMGRLADALRLLEETLQAQVSKLGPDHPDTLATMHNLGSYYREAGRLTDATSLLEKTLALRRARLKPAHPETLTTMNNLAVAYLAARRLPEARRLHEEALQLGRTVLDPDHPNVVLTMENLASCLMDQGEFTTAMQLLESCLEKRTRQDPDGWHTHYASCLLGRALLGMEKYPEAERRLREGHRGLLAQRARMPAPRQAQIADAARDMVDLYERWGKPEPAEEWRRKLPPALRIREGLERHYAWPILWGWCRF